MSQFKNSLVIVSAAAVVASGSIAHADTGSEWIVRLNKSVNSGSHAKRVLRTESAFDAIKGASTISVINGTEGVVRLKYKSAAEAATARAFLEQSSAVASVAPNLLYKKAMKLNFRDVIPGETPVTAPSLPILSLNTLATLPAVPLPPLNVVAGADPLLGQDWALKAVGMDRVPADVFASQSMITAVIDTGVDYTHEDLVGAMWRKPGEPSVVGMNTITDQPLPFDVVNFDIEGYMKLIAACQAETNVFAQYICMMQAENKQMEYLSNPGHGTHCAGHVAAVANNSLGIRGIGAGAQVMALKFFFDKGEPNAGAGDDAAAIKAIDYAIANGVKVISASWGGRQRRSDAEKSELKLAIERAQKAGVLMVIAAGNDPINLDTDAEPSFPAAYTFDNMIVVAASDQNDKLSDFSTYGAKGVHIAAPGVKIFSTVAANGTTPGGYTDQIAKFINPDTQKEQTVDWDGTSMATPMVAGAAALVWSKYPNETYLQIKERILKSARVVPALNGKVATGGVLDVAAALN